MDGRSGLDREQENRTPGRSLLEAAITDDRKNKRKWPKEVSLGEHTSLGPKSYCPDYRTLPVTRPDLGVSSRTTVPGTIDTP